MFERVLIANRGEIAVRIIRTCRDLGVRTIAVFSDPDATALHVRQADEAYPLGGVSPADSYLRIDTILEAARATGAQAIHPGYGFLAENATFAEAVVAAGLTFVGPPASAIAAMGDKISSRHVAASAGAIGVPGTAEAVASVANILAFGETHGYPIAIKASAGGGGKGMRVVAGPDEASGSLEAAQREAQAYFGDEHVYLERYLEWPRHVEMQIIADIQGNCVWLGERDCSIQRRHQKLVEESPAAAFPDAVREAMGEAAVRIARKVDYVGAGTIEFLYENGAFYFLEMNTRLQVEHPVTELVTGLDLVELQLRVAAGEPLPFAQDEIAREGHAIECRINAEDPSGGLYLPSPGRIARLEAPSGPGIRFDEGYRSGDEVSQYYDNLVGKLIVWGPDRETSRRRMLRALGELRVEGVATTAPALRLVLDHPDFESAAYSTKWLEGLEIPESPAPMVSPDPGTSSDQPQFVELWVNDRRYLVEQPADATTREAALVSSAPGRGRSPRRRGGMSVLTADESAVVSPMQGTIVQLAVEPGTVVEPGHTLCILEAMKMENKIVANRDGTVRDIEVAVGQSVAAGEVIMHVD